MGTDEPYSAKGLTMVETSKIKGQSQKVKQKKHLVMSQKKQDLLRIIKELDDKEAAKGLSEQNQKEKNEVKQEFQEVAIREEINWRQKSRIY